MKQINMASVSKLTGRLSESGRRFPMTFLFVVAFTITMMVCNHLDLFSDMGKTTFFFIFYLPSAALLALALHLWTEEMNSSKRRMTIQAELHALWLVSSLYFASCFPLDLSQTLSCTASITLMGVAVFALPFIKRGNDLSCVNFMLKMMWAAVLAFIISMALCLATELLLQSLHYLFNIYVSDKATFDIIYLSFCLLAPVLLLILIPKRENKFDSHDWLQNKFTGGVVHWLFIPLLSAYLITLYIYAFKILFSLQLPTGWVSWLVSALMLIMVVIVTLLYPAQTTPYGKRFDRAVLRYLSLLVLPLLVLMSIGIGRRLSDYGITISRLYLLVFNVWCYAVCIILYIIKSRRVIWIPVSFGVIFLLISVGPMNITSVTKKTLLKEVKALTDKLGVKTYPITKRDYATLMMNADSVTVMKIDDKLEYLRKMFDKESTAGIVSKYADVGDVKYDKSSTIKARRLDDCEMLLTRPEKLPSGYSRFMPVGDNDICFKKEEDNCIFFEVAYSKDKKEVFKLPISEMQRVNYAEKPRTLFVKNAHACLYIQDFSYSNDDEDLLFSLTGILFLKE